MNSMCSSPTICIWTVSTEMQIYVINNVNQLSRVVTEVDDCVKGIVVKENKWWFCFFFFLLLLFCAGYFQSWHTQAFVFEEFAQIYGHPLCLAKMKNNRKLGKTCLKRRLIVFGLIPSGLPLTHIPSYDTPDAWIMEPSPLKTSPHHWPCIL